MIKQTLLILILTSLFTMTGCVERGHTVVPTTQTAKVILKPKQSKTEKAEKPQAAPVNIVDVKENNDDTWENTISGILIFIIGVMVIL